MVGLYPSDYPVSQDVDSALTSNDRVRAFVLHLGVAADPTYPERLRAFAWAEMGHLTGTDPQFSIGDTDSGIFYFRRAIETDEECLWGWFGILHFFSDDNFPNSHHDVSLFSRALHLLYPLRDQFNDLMRSLIERAYVKYVHLLNL